MQGKFSTEPPSMSGVRRVLVSVSSFTLLILSLPLVTPHFVSLLFLAFFSLPTPPLGKASPIPVSEVGVGSQGFRALEDVTSAAGSCDWQLIYCPNITYLYLYPIFSASQEGTWPFACSTQSSGWRPSSLGRGFCRWKFNSGFVLCPCQFPLTHLMENTDSKWNAMLLVRRGFVCFVSPLLGLHPTSALFPNTQEVQPANWPVLVRSLMELDLLYQRPMGAVLSPQLSR